METENSNGSALHLPSRPLDVKGIIPSLLNLVGSISRFESVDSIFKNIFESVQEIFNISEMFIARLDEKKNLFVIKALSGYPPEDLKAIKRMGFTSEQIRLQSPSRFRVGRDSYYIRAEEWSHFNPRDPFYDHPEDLWKPRMRPDEWHEIDFFNFLLRDHHGNIVGFMELNDSEDGKLPSREEVEAIEIFAGLAGIAIETEKTFEASISEKQFSEMLIDLLSHDIENYNHVIIGCCDKMIESQYSKKHAEPLVGSIRGKSEKINSLISQVNRIAESKKRMRELDFCIDLPTAIQRSIIEMLNLFPNKALRFNFHPPDGMCLARADDLIEEVFISLLSNAVKYDIHERINVDISVESKRDGENDYWVVHITDHGTGIPDTDKGKIFERYHRTGDGLSARQGLGLFISKSLVAGYGGDIWASDRVEGRPEEGARFCVMVPKFSENQQQK
ncbi:MAG TPA: HAMP domain-containing histidine kinase [Euryarchaeota archaeon]|nr:HAMP domain-containing histidine kinase [Euryarchaeota archaeon]